DHWDAVGRFHEATKGCFVTRPVGLDDVGAKLSAQADVASQVFESVPLLELVDRGVGRWKFGFRDERDAVSFTCAADPRQDADHARLVLPAKRGEQEDGVGAETRGSLDVRDLDDLSLPLPALAR